MEALRCLYEWNCVRSVNDQCRMGPGAPSRPSVRLALAALHLLSHTLLLKAHTGGGPRLAGPRRLTTARGDSRWKMGTNLLAACKTLGDA